MGLDPDFLSRCQRDPRVRLSLRKGAWSVPTPQASTGNRGNGAPSVCVGERRTAGPSTTLRSGRDDKFVLGTGILVRKSTCHPDRSVAEPAVLSIQLKK